MLIVKVKEGDSIEKALKQMKRKFNMTKMVKQLREREQFTKPSTAKRETKKKAIYVQNIRTNEDKDI
jgi:small subunit ribosomal protein S21